MKRLDEVASKFLYLPDFCTSRAALANVLIVELTAVVLTLARENVLIGFWTDLSRTSMFLLWIGLAGAALLCWMRGPLNRMQVGPGSATVLALMALLVALVSAGTWELGRSYLFTEAGAGVLFPQDLADFIGRNVVIGAIVTALALRYFYVTHEWRRNIEMQATARVHTLQARIRPHFLFNSMNTIASLTRSNPNKAEEAVQDLADLFRANLSDKRDAITLAEECEVAQTYQRIEQLRLGERLRVDWKLDGLPLRAIVPGLMLQPLLENAIYHGIEPKADGGVVTVTGELSDDLITIVVRNPVGDYQNEREGNRLALANIRERMELLYGERGLVKSGRFDDEFIVTLRFPLVEQLPKLAT